MTTPIITYTFTQSEVDALKALYLCFSVQLDHNISTKEGRAAAKEAGRLCAVLDDFFVKTGIR